MRFCKKRLYEYKNNLQIDTTIHYVILEDIIQFHGKEFADKWLEYINKLPCFVINNEKCYYYSDYEFCARRTDSFLNPQG